MGHSNRRIVGYVAQPLPLDAPAWHHAMYDRILSACSGRSARSLASLVDISPETVRRTLLGQRPRVEFLVKLSRTMGLSGDWLLTGRGPMHTKDQVAAALKQASEMQLCAELGARLERLARAVPNRTRAVSRSNGRSDCVGPALSLAPHRETAEHGTGSAGGGLSV